MGNTTIRILARKLQLSTATVSKALTDSHEISDATKKRVQALAAELNYTPNPYASGLRNKKSRTIAMVLPEVADSFFAQVIDGVESIAQEKGYHVLIRLTHENVPKEQAILKDLGGGRVDGVLMSVSSDTTDPAAMIELQEKGIPLVFFDRRCEEIDTASVITDDLESAYKATLHLIQRKCRRIAFLSISPVLSISRARLEGYKKALSEAQLVFRESDVVLCSSQDAALHHQTLKELMTRPDPPDGILATVEKLATSIYLVCQELQLKIPQQVKIIGFSNLPAATVLNPSLTTVTQPAFEIGKAAASLLFKALAGKGDALKKQQQVVPSTLVIRNSTGGPQPTGR